MTDRRLRPTGPRVVVTGFGAVSAWGWGADGLWAGLRSGRTGIRRAERFDTTGHRTDQAGEAPAPPEEVAAACGEWRRLSRADRFAAAAAIEACRRASLPPRQPLGPDSGVFFGGSTAGMAEGEDFFRRLTEGRPGRARIGLLVSHQLNGPGDEVARLLGVSGPVRSVSSACASGGLAIGLALEALRTGEVEVALAGGSDSLCQLTYAGFNSLRAVDAKPCLPFRRDRAGLNLGEGAGVLVLETLERARRRGVPPLAEVLGAGASCDAHHMTAPHPRGVGAALAVELALGDAGVPPDEVDFINAHGTGTPLNDVSEWWAIEKVFGERAPRLPVTSTKGSVGHLLGSSGAIEAVVTVQCLLAAEVHPTPGEGPVDGAFAIDLVTDGPRALERPSDRPMCAVSTSFGFGGANAAVVLASFEQDAGGAS